MQLAWPCEMSWVVLNLDPHSGAHGRKEYKGILGQAAQIRKAP